MNSKINTCDKSTNKKKLVVVGKWIVLCQDDKKFALAIEGERERKRVEVLLELALMTTDHDVVHKKCHLK